MSTKTNNITATKRVCRDCGEEKDIAHYEVKSYITKTKITYQKRCRLCLLAHRRNQQKRLELKWLYGLSLHEYEAKWSQQKGVCSICKKPELQKTVSGKPKSLTVDHNHKTGKNRGLLCMVCNVFLRVLEDVPDWEKKAKKYLDKHSNRPPDAQRDLLGSV